MMSPGTRELVVASPPPPPIRYALTQIAAELDARFVRAGDALAAAIELSEQIVGGLDAIVSALDARDADAATDDLAEVAAAITALPAALTARGRRIATITDIAALLRAHVLDMHRSLRMLRAYGMNIKIAAAGEAQFVSFVEGMEDKIAAGEALLTEVIRALNALDAAVVGVQQADRRLAGDCAHAVPALPQRLLADARALGEHRSGNAQIAVRVGAIARAIQTKVARLLHAMQIGDRTRQRLDHVVAALELLDARTYPPAARAHVERLLAAQLAQIVQDFERETGALIGNLQGLLPDVAALGALLADQAGEVDRGTLIRLDRSVSDADRIIVPLRAAQRQAEEMGRLIAATVSDLTARIDGLGAIRTDVQEIATNTRLLCRQHSDIGRAVAVVAQEVDLSASGLGTTATEVGRTIGELGTAQRLLGDEGGGIDGGARLGRALTTIRTAVTRTERLVRDGSEDARRLVALLETSAAELGREFALGGPITQVQALLSERAEAAPVPAPADEGALRTLLPAIADLYTMASERDIHVDFLLPGMALIGHPAHDEDGLF